MGRYTTLFGKNMRETQVKTIEAIVEEINSTPPDFTPTRHMEIPNAMLDALIRQYGTDLTDTKERHVKIDVKTMIEKSPLRGGFEERIVPLLDGLSERGGMLNGQRIKLSIDKDDLRLLLSPPKLVSKPARKWYL